MGQQDDTDVEGPATTSAVSGGSAGTAVERLVALVERLQSQGALARYELGAVLGRGGAGEVIAAEDPLIRRTVALKRLRSNAPEDRVSRRFVLEAQVTGQLEHPNIVPVYDIGVETDGTVFFTMRRVVGRSLSQILRAGEGGSLAKRLSIFLKVCDAIDYAHARGVVHRDLKPGNVMIGSHGEVLVLDWGLAKLLHDDSTTETAEVSASEDHDAELTSDAVIGTPAYMAPEQARGARVDARTDVYALGATLYALLVGRGPFPSGSDILLRVRDGRFDPPRAVVRTIPRELDAIVRCAMATPPLERYPNVAELRADVEAFLDGREVSALAITISERLWKSAVRRRAVVLPVAATLAAAVAVLLLATALYAFGAVRSRDRALAAERTAELRSAESQGSLALALADQGQASEAREELRAAKERLRALGASDVGIGLAASWVEHRFPRPIVAWRTDGPASAAIAPDGSKALLVYGDVARLFSLPDGALLSEVASPTGSTRGGAIYLADRPVVSWLEGEVATLTDVVTGERFPQIEIGPVGGLATALASPLERDRLMNVSRRHGTRVLDLPTGEAVASLPGVWATGASPDFSFVYGRPAKPGTEIRNTTETRVWEVATGSEVGVFRQSSVLALSDDLRALTARDGQLQVVDVRDGTVLSSSPHGPSEVANFAAGGTQVLRMDRLGARWQDAATGQVVRAMPAAGAISASGGGVAATADGRQLMSYWGDNVQVWSRAAAQPRHRLSASGLNAVELSSDGALALVGGADGVLRVVDPATGTVLTRMRKPVEADALGTRDVAFSHDGRFGYAADRDGAVRVMDLGTGTLEAQLEARTELEVVPIAMSVAEVGEGRVAVGYADGALWVWDWRNGRVEHRVDTGLESNWGLAFDAQRRWLVVSGRMDGPRFVVVDPDAGRVVGTSEGHVSAYRVAVASDGRVLLGEHLGGASMHQILSDGSSVVSRRFPIGAEVVMAVAFAPDVSLAAIGAYDGRVMFVDPNSGEALSTMRLHENGVSDLAFDRTGTRLVSVGADGALVYLRLDLAERLDQWAPVLDPARPGDGSKRRLEDLALASSSRGDWSSAVALFDRAFGATSGEGGLERARALRMQGRTEDALAVLARAVDRGEVAAATLDLWRGATPHEEQQDTPEREAP